MKRTEVPPHPLVSLFTPCVQLFSLYLYRQSVVYYLLVTELLNLILFHQLCQCKAEVSAGQITQVLELVKRATGVMFQYVIHLLAVTLDKLKVKIHGVLLSIRI